MFPLHRSNELCFQISPNPHKKQEITEDLILGHDNYSASLDDHNASDYANKDGQIESRSRRKLFLPSLSNTNNNPQSSDDNKTSKKKMKHRDIERQRRQEMASLHASLRSLLPLQLIKGKRSISDHINEAARYIKHLQMKIKDLAFKRDELKIKYFPDSTTSTAPSTDRHWRESSISSYAPARGWLSVQPCYTGVEISISTTGHFDEGSFGNFPLSRVLEVLLGEGLSVVSSVSTKVNGIFFHTIQSEAGDREFINTSALEQKLKEVLFPFQ